MPEADHGNHPDSCPHEEVTKLELIDRQYLAVHGPSSEIWRVKCLDCGEIFRDRFIGD